MAASGVVALAEDGCAEADSGGAFFDGYLEVVAHAHGKLGEGGAEGLVFVAEAAEALEGGAGELGVFGEGGNSHEAADFEVFQGLERGEERGQVFGGEAMLGVFVREFDFNKNAEGLVKGLGGGVEALGGFEGVEGVDCVEEFCGLSSFVILERADEVGLRGEWGLHGVE